MCCLPGSKKPKSRSKEYPADLRLVGSSVATTTVAQELEAPGPPPVPPSW